MYPKFWHFYTVKASYTFFL